MAELLFNEFFCTYPFHIFAYLPFHSTLRISGRKILLVSVMAELLYLTVFALLVSAGLPAVYVQYTAIPVFGIFLYSLVKANVGIITFQYIFVIDYLMVIRCLRLLRLPDIFPLRILLLAVRAHHIRSRTPDRLVHDEAPDGDH